jgi:uncharacterized repeat protein (TIGR01451 family)
MTRDRKFGRRLAQATALMALLSVGLVFGVPSGTAGFGLDLAKVGSDGVADLEVTKADSVDPVRIGENFHYSIRIRNLGPDDATGVRLVDTLPASFELVESTGAKSCERDGDVYCELNDIPHEGSVTVILHVRASTPGTFSDTATAKSDVADPDETNNSATESTTVIGRGGDQPQAHLVVIDHVVNDNGGKGSAGDFALAVKAGAPSPAEFGGAEAPGTDVTIDPGSYAVSQETALGYLTTLSADCEGEIGAGETRTCTVTNDDVAPVTLAIVADAPSVQPGATTGYAVTLTNPNAQDVAVSNLGVTLPVGFSYQPGSTTGTVTADPQVGGASPLLLTWAGPIDVPGNESTSLHFAATASASPGAYAAGVSANVDVPFTLAVTNATAPITVLGPAGSTQSAGGGSTPQTGSSPSQGPPPATGPTAPTKPTVAPPVFQKSADVEPVSGNVFVRLPGSTDFVPLTSEIQVGFGAEIDATGGRVAVSTVDANGTLYHADFYEGQFLVRNQFANGITVLQLSGSSFKSCKAAKKRTLAAFDKKKPKKAKKAKVSKKVVRHLWGSGKGKFRTRGRYVAASVHGTTWLTEDRCDGTRAFVQEGVVDVRDLVKHKTVQLGAGQSYVGKPGH